MDMTRRVVMALVTALAIGYLAALAVLALWFAL